jgi:hypothetical protein
VGDRITTIFSGMPVAAWLTRLMMLEPICAWYVCAPVRTVGAVACCQEVYCKMRCLVDRGVSWVGHGLMNDFRALNLYVPPDMVRERGTDFVLAVRRSADSCSATTCCRSSTQWSCFDSRGSETSHFASSPLTCWGSMFRYLDSTALLCAVHALTALFDSIVAGQ